MDFTLSPSYKYLQEEKAIIFEVTKWLDIQLLPSDAIKGTKQNSNSSQRTFKFAKYIMKKPHCAAIWALSCPHSYSHTSWRLEKNNHPALSWHEKDAKGPCLSHKLHECYTCVIWLFTETLLPSQIYSLPKSLVPSHISHPLKGC